jgi:hypothetical protein
MDCGLVTVDSWGEKVIITCVIGELVSGFVVGVIFGNLAGWF